MILDSGALIAADRDDRRFWGVFELARREQVIPVVLTPVLTEVWRDGRRQARLGQALRGCRFVAPDADLARAAGVLCAKSGLDDPVDALVVAYAAQQRDLVITTDIGDLRTLAGYARGARIREL